MEYYSLFNGRLHAGRGTNPDTALEFYVAIPDPKALGGEKHIFFVPVYSLVSGGIEGIGLDAAVTRCSPDDLLIIDKAYDEFYTLILIYYALTVIGEQGFPYSKWAIEQLLQVPLNARERQIVEARLSAFTNIYIIRDQDTGYHKIGRSNDPEARLRQLVKQDTLLPTPNNFVIVWVWPDIPHKERMLHRVYADKRVRGEWFDLSAEDLEYISANYVAEEGKYIS